MNRRELMKGAAALGLVGSLPEKSSAQQTMAKRNITTRAGDNYRTGAYIDTVLTRDAVIKRGIRPYFTVMIEGDARGIEAQPLFLDAVKQEDGTVRDVCILASMNNLLKAFDANSSDELWEFKLGVPIDGNGDIDSHRINDHWGVLSTPVIDEEEGIVYAVAWTSIDKSPQKGQHFLHARYVSNGAKAMEPVALANATYTTPDGKVWKYNSNMRKQRCSLTIARIAGRKTILWGSGTVKETSSGSAGWAFAFDTATKILTAFAFSGGRGAGVWMAGSGFCVDDQEYIWCCTGNGDFDPTNGNYGETVCKLKYTPPIAKSAGKFEMAGWWTAYTDQGKMGGDVTGQKRLALPENKTAGENAPTSAGHMKMVEDMGDMDGPTNEVPRRLQTAKSANPHLMITKPARIDGAFSDEDLGSAGVFLIPECNVAGICGKDGILYEVNMKTPGNTQPKDMLNAAANYKKLVQPPIFFTYYAPGIDPAPQDPSTLDFLYRGQPTDPAKTRHNHSTPVRVRTKNNGMVVCCGGENTNVRVWNVDSKGKFTYLAQGEEVASAEVTRTPGGMTGSFMAISYNPDAPGNALLWALMPYGDANATVTKGRLLCYDLENFKTYPNNGGQGLNVLWDSQRWGVTFDFDKFLPPVIYKGKIWFGNYNGSGALALGLA